VLSIGEYDERVFLGEDAPDEIGTPAKVLLNTNSHSCLGIATPKLLLMPRYYKIKFVAHVQIASQNLPLMPGYCRTKIVAHAEVSLDQTCCSCLVVSRLTLSFIAWYCRILCKFLVTPVKIMFLTESLMLGIRFILVYN